MSDWVDVARMTDSADQSVRLAMLDGVLERVLKLLQPWTNFDWLFHVMELYDRWRGTSGTSVREEPCVHGFRLRSSCLKLLLPSWMPAAKAVGCAVARDASFLYSYESVGLPILEVIEEQLAKESEQPCCLRRNKSHV